MFWSWTGRYIVLLWHRGLLFHALWHPCLHLMLKDRNSRLLRLKARSSRTDALSSFLIRPSWAWRGELVSVKSEAEDVWILVGQLLAVLRGILGLQLDFRSLDLLLWVWIIESQLSEWLVLLHLPLFYRSMLLDLLSQCSFLHLT